MVAQVYHQFPERAICLRWRKIANPPMEVLGQTCPTPIQAIHSAWSPATAGTSQDVVGSARPMISGRVMGRWFPRVLLSPRASLSGVTHLLNDLGSSVPAYADVLMMREP